MSCFIHTADWQIGKLYLQVEDDQKRFKLQQERVNVIRRIRDAARNKEAQFVLVAGDLFDSPTPSNSSVLEVLEAIGDITIPVLVIPGNHDHGALGTIWHRDDFQRHRRNMAPNLVVLLERKPFELDQAVILPCPLLRNQDNNDPTLWIKGLDWNILPSNKPRIVLAHGGVFGFEGRDYELEKEAPRGANNLIDIHGLSTQEIDYIALGDWHNLKQISPHAWYSGTPEPDRFDQGHDNQRGQVLLIKVIRAKAPQVETISTGRIQWHNFKFRFKSDSDLGRLERLIEELTLGRVSRDLLRIEISGSLSLAGHRRYEEFKADLENKLLRLRIKGECQKTPEADELEQLTTCVEDPLIAQVAAQLQQRLERESDQGSEQAAIIRIALCELFRFSMKAE